MSGRQGSVNPVENDRNTARLNMMDMWRESLRQARDNKEAPVSVAKSEHDAKAELEQRIRNGQAPCPTCAARTYKDESDDGGVSFQAAKSISAPTAGIVVMNHEHEHVSSEKSKQKSDGMQRNSTVALEYAKCPQCGRTYVAGGVTKTSTEHSSVDQSEISRKNSLDVRV